MPDLSSLLFGGGGGCPRGYSTQGCFVSISGSIAGYRSISDQKNLDGLSPVKNAWMARDGWRSGIPWTCEVNRPTNWERGASLPWTNPMREAVVGLGRALAMKFNSNSFANRSNEDIEAGSWSSQGGWESPTYQRVGRVVQGHLGAECSDVLCRIAAAIVRLEGRESKATLRSSWHDSRGGCMSFRDLALWRLRLKLGLPCLDLASEAKKSLSREDEWSRVGRGCMGFYSNGYGAPVPEVLTAPVAYHAVVLRRSLDGPR
ncbi:hypothetical protein BHM03_00055097, partial [Ensete ventricosum]